MSRRIRGAGGEPAASESLVLGPHGEHVKKKNGVACGMRGNTKQQKKQATVLPWVCVWAGGVHAGALRTV